MGVPQCARPTCFSRFSSSASSSTPASLMLDSGIFTCITPGYYAVSFSAHAVVTSKGQQILYLYKNGAQLPESVWHFGTSTGISLGVTGSRMLILHMDTGDTLELRMTDGEDISFITLNIELVGLGFDLNV